MDLSEFDGGGGGDMNVGGGGGDMESGMGGDEVLYEPPPGTSTSPNQVDINVSKNEEKKGGDDTTKTTDTTEGDSKTTTTSTGGQYDSMGETNIDIMNSDLGETATLGKEDGDGGNEEEDIGDID